MAGAHSSYRWMETLLDLLITQYDRSEAITFLRDLGERERAIKCVTGDLVAAGMPAGMLATPEGQNLFVAVLSLRIKFEADEAREKVRLNIRMREGRI